MDPIISVYAELLLNIRQLTISIALASPCDPDTTVELSPDREAIQIHHQAQRIVVALPARLAPHAVLPRPLPPTKDLCFRLKVVPERHCLHRNELDLADSGIWPASSLTPDTRVACRACQNLLLHSSVTTWKDLPSDNWADMMDLWHCHKPAPEHGTQRDAAHRAKGYDASNSLTLPPGGGLVHLDYVRVHRSDCVGLQVRVELFFFPFSSAQFFPSVGDASPGKNAIHFLLYGTQESGPDSGLPSDLVMWPPIQRPEIDSQQTLLLEQARLPPFHTWGELRAPGWSGLSSRLDADRRGPRERWSVLQMSWGI